MEVITIREAIAQSEQLPSDSILYAPVGRELTADTKCALITQLDWDYENDEDPPEFYIVDGVTTSELLPIDPFQEVVWNAYDQRPEASDLMLIEALKFYVKRDAFIDFDLNPDLDNS